LYFLPLHLRLPQVPLGTLPLVGFLPASTRTPRQLTRHMSGVAGLKRLELGRGATQRFRGSIRDGREKMPQKGLVAVHGEGARGVVAIKRRGSRSETSVSPLLM